MVCFVLQKLVLRKEGQVSLLGSVSKVNGVFSTRDLPSTFGVSQGKQQAYNVLRVFGIPEQLRRGLLTPGAGVC